jgi:hypothetical protein
MNKFEAHINPNKTLKLKRENGEEDTFTLQPLPYKYLPKIFQLFNKLKDLDGVGEEETNKFFEVFDKETIELLQELCFETMKRSYPEEKDNVLQDFVTSNLFEIFPVIIEVNSFGVDIDNVETKKKAETLKKLNK